MRKVLVPMFFVSHHFSITSLTKADHIEFHAVTSQNGARWTSTRDNTSRPSGGTAEPPSQADRRFSLERERRRRWHPLPRAPLPSLQRRALSLAISRAQRQRPVARLVSAAPKPAQRRGADANAALKNEYLRPIKWCKLCNERAVRVVSAALPSFTGEMALFVSRDMHIISFVH